MRCDRLLLLAVQFNLLLIGIEIISKCKENCKIMKKIHLNRQSGMNLACSSCVFDVVSSIGGSHISML